MDKLQDIRIRNVPQEMARRLKAALTRDGTTLAEWFMLAAARTADAYEKPPQLPGPKGGKR